MPIRLKEEGGGRILVVNVTGKLVKADYGPFAHEFERLFQQHGKLRLLFDMTGLHGWDAGAAWEDLKFDIKHFSDIDRLAIVGEKKWQENMVRFSSHSRKRRSDISITPTPPMHASGCPRRRDFGRD
jgi:hypothetical protein